MLPEWSRTKLARMVDAGEVLVRGRLEKPGFRLSPGMLVELDEPESAVAHDLTPADIPLDVVYQDDRLLVINKPRGLASHPAPTLREPSLVNALLHLAIPLSEAAGTWRPGIVHRLDKDTTGLMVVAKDDAAHIALARQLESKTAERRYVAAIVGEFEHERLKVDAPIGRHAVNRQLMTVDPYGRSAVTHLKRLRRGDFGWILGCRLETGRTHQIRVHLRAIGHPVLGDRLYGVSPTESPLQLHAAFLGFDHPEDGRRVSFFAEPPSDFTGVATFDDLEPW